jgi:hypothetical protein
VFLNRRQIFHREDNGPLPNGSRATRFVEDQPKLAQIILGNGTAEFDGITSVLLTNSFADNRYTVNINGNRVLYLVAHVRDLGSIAGLECLIEFNNPDFPPVVDEETGAVVEEGFWLPSKEGASRESGEAGNIWGPLPAGGFILRSGEEHMHHKLARFSFRTSTATAPNASTHIRLSWFHDGKVATVPEQ